MLYVAYGSNMNLEQMKYRCPNSKVVGTGVVKGYKLVFNVHADIIRTANQNDEVPVVIWDISDDDLKSLDIYEGYPRYYIKKNVKVISDNEIVDALVYVMSKNHKGFELPYLDYYYTIEKGYIDNNIDLKSLRNAIVYTEKMIKKLDNRLEV